MFHTEKNASIQEIGPRFTLKLEYLRRGLPDDNFAGINRISYLPILFFIIPNTIQSISINQLTLLEYEWIRGKDAEARTNRLKFFL